MHPKGGQLVAFSTRANRGAPLRWRSRTHNTVRSKGPRITRLRTSHFWSPGVIGRKFKNGSGVDYKMIFFYLFTEIQESKLMSQQRQHCLCVGLALWNPNPKTYSIINTCAKNKTSNISSLVPRTVICSRWYWKNSNITVSICIIQKIIVVLYLKNIRHKVFNGDE